MMLTIFLAASISMAPALAGECVEVRGDKVTVADLVPQVPEFAALPQTESLGYAPQPGVHRRFRRIEVQALGRKHGVELVSPPEVCVRRALRTLQEDEIRAAIRAALPQEPSTLVVREWSRFPVPVGVLRFELHGMRPTGKGLEVLWTGAVEYADHRQFRVWARAQIGIQARRVVAATDIPGKSEIRPGHVREEGAEILPGVESGLKTEDVVGKVARRRLSSGVPLRREDLEAPPAIQQGDPVLLVSRVGGASASVTTIAQSGGKIGQNVILLNAASGRKIRATISGPGTATLQRGRPN